MFQFLGRKIVVFLTEKPLGLISDLVGIEI